VAESEDRPYRILDDGAQLVVRLTPRASRTGIDGIGADESGRAFLQIRLDAPPVDGAANKALIAYLAKALGVRKSAISITSGETARLKRLHIAGDGKALAEKLNVWATPKG
jgi:uncharacterized protein (TIGR00251 family)